MSLGKSKRYLLAGCLGLCLLGCFLQPWNEFLVFDRSAIASGQVWRMWTGHFVHFGSGHLLPNLLVSVVLISLMQTVTKWETMLLFTVIPGVISLGLLCLSTQLEAYAGFSGIASALMANLIIERLAKESREVTGWLLAGALLAKTIWEFSGNEALLANFSEQNVQVEPVAHLVGAAAMALGLLATKAAGRFRTTTFETTQPSNTSA